MQALDGGTAYVYRSGGLVGIDVETGASEPLEPPPVPGWEPEFTAISQVENGVVLWSTSSSAGEETVAFTASGLTRRTWRDEAMVLSPDGRWAVNLSAGTVADLGSGTSTSTGPRWMARLR